MEDERIRLVGAAFLSGCAMGKRPTSRIAPEYQRPRMAHKVPRLPIRIDGDRRPQNAVQRFDGKPLYYVLEPAPRSDEIAVFTTSELADEFAAKVQGSGRDHGEGRARQRAEALAADVQFGGYVALYEHVDYGGAEWVFWARWGNIPDFTKVYPTLWWSADINDRVSSADTYVSAMVDEQVNTWTVLHEHINYEGSQLRIPYGPNALGFRPNLVDYGFNDIASSMSYRIVEGQ